MAGFQYRVGQKKCPRLRDLATAPAGGITQPRTHFLDNSVHHGTQNYSVRRWFHAQDLVPYAMQFATCGGKAWRQPLINLLCRGFISIDRQYVPTYTIPLFILALQLPVNYLCLGTLHWAPATMPLLNPLNRPNPQISCTSQQDFWENPNAKCERKKRRKR